MSINVTLIGQMITFALLVWFTMKFVWPPIMQALEERKKKIADGLAAAERGKHEMELAEQRVQSVLKEAKQQAADIVSNAHKRADEMMEEGKQAAEAERQRRLSATAAEVDQEIERARQSLRQEVASLALTAAGQILQQEVDEQKHRELLDSVAKQLDQAK